MPPWNVPASGLPTMMRGPNGEDTQAGVTGGDIVIGIGTRDAAASDGFWVTPSANTTALQRIHT
jgi:hypothetical protein